MMINTAVETQATTNVANYEKLAQVVDQFLIDIKNTLILLSIKHYLVLVMRMSAVI